MSVRVDVRLDTTWCRFMWSKGIPWMQGLERVDMNPPRAGPEFELRFRFPDDVMPEVALQRVIERLKATGVEEYLAIRANHDYKPHSPVT